jgi:hypothetical protein
MITEAMKMTRKQDRTNVLEGQKHVPRSLSVYNPALYGASNASATNSAEQLHSNAFAISALNSNPPRRDEIKFKFNKIFSKLCVNFSLSNISSI